RNGEFDQACARATTGQRRGRGGIVAARSCPHGGCMKTLFTALVALLALHAAPAFAASPLVGRWALDIASLPMPPEARPKSVTLTFAQPDDGTWQTGIEIIAPDGGKMDSAATLALDGTPGKVTGSYWA